MRLLGKVCWQIPESVVKWHTIFILSFTIYSCPNMLAFTSSPFGTFYAGIKYSFSMNIQIKTRTYRSVIALESRL